MTRARYSIPYFVSPDVDAVIECLDACTDETHPVRHVPIVQGDYRLMRARVQYKSSVNNTVEVGV
jgi:isopenicillin N synthase-like dioxygenase